jgi:hypothetical protein
MPDVIFYAANGSLTQHHVQAVASSPKRHVEHERYWAPASIGRSSGDSTFSVTFQKEEEELMDLIGNHASQDIFKDSFYCNWWQQGI